MVIKKEQIEQYRKIIADAPDGATHVDSLGYWKMTEDPSMSDWFCESWGAGASWSNAYDVDRPLRDLSDLRTIVAQYDDNKKLREALEWALNCLEFDKDDMPDAWQKLNNTYEVLK